MKGNKYPTKFQAIWPRMQLENLRLGRRRRISGLGGGVVSARVMVGNFVLVSCFSFSLSLVLLARRRLSLAFSCLLPISSRAVTKIWASR
jgi:hypothetical protein